jgi:hypothetical protein
VQVGLDSTQSHISSVLVGTESSEIYEVAKDTGSALLLAEGHFDDELWGLAPCPTNKDVLATCGDDRCSACPALPPSCACHQQS